MTLTKDAKHKSRWNAEIFRHYAEIAANRNRNQRAQKSSSIRRCRSKRPVKTATMPKRRPPEAPAEKTVADQSEDLRCRLPVAAETTPVVSDNVGQQTPRREVRKSV